MFFILPPDDWANVNHDNALSAIAWLYRGQSEICHQAPLWKCTQEENHHQPKAILRPHRHYNNRDDVCILYPYHLLFTASTILRNFTRLSLC